MQSVNRALDVLFHLAGRKQPASAAAIAEKVGLPRPTVYRILDTLVDRNLVEKAGPDFAIVDDEIRRLVRR
jgi:DNA-binding IclR family transcriptional regulator